MVFYFAFRNLRCSYSVVFLRSYPLICKLVIIVPHVLQAQVQLHVSFAVAWFGFVCEVFRGYFQKSFLFWGQRFCYPRTENATTLQSLQSRLQKTLQQQLRQWLETRLQ